MQKQIEQTLTSLEVAEMIGKRHDNLIADIREYIKEFSLLNFQGQDYFQEDVYKNRGREYPCYQITKKGCEFVAHKLTGLKGTEFTVKYIERFHDMQHILSENNLHHWQQTRLESKKNRRLEAEEIKQLVEYAKAQGSENAEKYYITLSKLANKTVGISSTERERANINQLNTLILVENIINHRIQEGMKQGLHYKEIYQTCKERLKQFKEIAYLTEIKAIQEGK